MVFLSSEALLLSSEFVLAGEGSLEDGLFTEGDEGFGGRHALK